MFKFRLTQEHPDELFRKAVVLSLLLHIGLWAGFALIHFLYHPSELIEIDLTQPFHVGGNPLLKPGGGNLPTKPKHPGPPPLPEPKARPKPAPPKEWVLPTPQTKRVEKPQLQSPPPSQTSPLGVPESPSPGYQGTGPGISPGTGEGGGVRLTQKPRLLNAPEILRFLRDNYPFEEKRFGHEGVVVLDITISPEGTVTKAAVYQSAGKYFDEIALKAAQRMKFTPPKMGDRAVAVTVPQPIDFNLEALQEQ